MAVGVAIACGGTGGHLFPGVAVADELRERGIEPLLLISRKSVDAVAVEGTGHAFRALSAIGWPGLATPRVASFAFNLAKAWFEFSGLLRERRPAAVLGMGGFTCAVPLWQAALRGIPCFIHESNVIPGRVTRGLARRVRRVLVGFEQCRERLPRDARVTVTGTPIRRGLFEVPKAQGVRFFGLDASRKTVLVMGGSQGASGLNEAVISALPRLRAHRDRWQFLHLAGRDDRARVEQAYRAAGLPSVVLDFCSHMAEAYALADMAVARSGAASLGELGTAGIPSILVPFPHAADNHQWFNAKVFADAGAAVLFEQRSLQAEALAGAIERILDQPGAAEAMRRACAGFSCAGAAGRVADAVTQEIRP